MMKITDRSPLPPAPVFKQGPGPEPADRKNASFMDAVDGAVNQVNRLQKTAEDATGRLATGEVKDLHQTMIALEKADVSFRFIVEVRNKVIEAYREIMRMQI